MSDDITSLEVQQENAEHHGDIVTAARTIFNDRAAVKKLAEVMDDQIHSVTTETALLRALAFLAN